MTRTQTEPRTVVGTRLVAFTETALCDRHQHEVVIVTDGTRAYVYPLDGAGVMEDTAVARTGVTLTAVCPIAMDHDTVQCDGQLVWRLDTDNGWGADADALRLLTAYGLAVES